MSKPNVGTKKNPWVVNKWFEKQIWKLHKAIEKWKYDKQGNKRIAKLKFFHINQKNRRRQKQQYKG